MIPIKNKKKNLEATVEEMRNFVKVINNELPLSYSFEEDFKILKILESIEKSCDESKANEID